MINKLLDNIENDIKNKEMILFVSPELYCELQSNKKGFSFRTFLKDWKEGKIW